MIRAPKQQVHLWVFSLNTQSGSGVWWPRGFLVATLREGIARIFRSAGFLFILFSIILLP